MFLPVKELYNHFSCSEGLQNKLFESLFLRNCDASDTNNYTEFKFNLSCVLMINQNLCQLKDLLDANGFKTLTEIVLEPNASPKHQQDERRLKSLKIFKYNIFGRRLNYCYNIWQKTQLLLQFGFISADEFLFNTDISSFRRVLFTLCLYSPFKVESHIVVIVVIIDNRKQVQANSERNLSQLLQIICSLYA